MNVERVTDFRIDKVEMTAEAYRALPQDAKILLHAYAEKFRQEDGFARFELPIYRWKEINEAMKVLKP